MRISALVLLAPLMLVFCSSFAEAAIGPSCCENPSENPVKILADLTSAAVEMAGERNLDETLGDYQVKLNEAYLTVFSNQDWRVLDALEALPDQTLCNGSCTGFGDLRHIVEAAVNLKAAEEADSWNLKSLVVGAIAAFVAMLGTLITYLTFRQKS